MDLGVYCYEKACKQLDFLPLTCKYCQQRFCQNHFKSLAVGDKSLTGHQCKNHPQDSMTLICPLCGEIVRKVAGRDPNQLVNEHINQGCKSKSTVQVYSNGCSFKGCTKRELIPIKCQSCNLQFCIRHRLEADHTCTLIQAKPSTKSSLPAKGSLAAKPRKQSGSKPRKECIVS